MRRVSVHIAHKLLYAWFILRQRESQIIGQRETVSVFCFFILVRAGNSILH